MRLGDFSCGCDSRKEIMFTAGKLGMPEAVILTAAVLSVIIGYKIGH